MDAATVFSAGDVIAAFVVLAAVGPATAGWAVMAVDPSAAGWAVAVDSSAAGCTVVDPATAGFVALLGIVACALASEVLVL